MNPTRSRRRVPQIHLATVASRKTAYLQAANGQALVAWCLRQLDEASGFFGPATEPERGEPFRIKPGHVETKAHIWIEASLARKRAYNAAAKAQTPPLALGAWVMGVLDRASGYTPK